ncbi:MAG: 4-hydroxybenzoate--CoA ligase [Rhodospirillaceae bacterium TMED8]|nr:4-hydroxybenzoate--CoA ligase [Magnetovibrio sp.]OUT48323.1 MAG: 4-hydroxybenzoate--CoA ligase [Rhodospirillaceae bacterium TMED8]
MTASNNHIWHPPRIYNAAYDFVDGNILAGRSEKAAFIDRSGMHTYGDLAERVNRFGNGLINLGVRREERVACCLTDTIDFPTVFFGAIKMGAVPVMINTLLTEENYRYILTDCRARVLVVSAELLDIIEPVVDEVSGINTVIISGRTPVLDTGQKDLSVVIGKQDSDLKAAETRPDEVAFWLYSSGSTGEPKGVKHLHASMMHTARQYAWPILNICENDIVFSAAKLCFAYGLGNGLSFPMSVGATTVLFDSRPTPDDIITCLRQHQPTIFYGVPTLYAALLANPNNSRETASQRLRIAVSAGEPLASSIGEKFEERFGCIVLDGVGSTEMLHIYVSNRIDDNKYGTSGKPVSGYDICLVDIDGSDIPDGRVGEMLVRGASMAEGYWNRREKNLATFVGPWLWTGDKYVKLLDGFYQYAGRSDDMFKSGGNWVSPFDVESALIEHPAVLESGVIPCPDEAGNMKPKAYVVLNEGVAQSKELVDDLKVHVKERIEVWKYPRWIEFTEKLPKTATGKIQRFKLRAADMDRDR